ncbi:MAG: hypothetical protein ACE10K_02505 [Rhodothermales bacterium]
MDRIRTDSPVDDQEAAASRIKAASREGIDHTNRDAFGLRLQQQYHQYAVNETPFLLIAMRGEAAPPLDFSLFYECVGKLLTHQDDWLVDFQDQRLIVLLAQSLPDVAQRFFARLKVRLFEAAPQQAQAYLHTVSAIVVPNGESFQNAEDFLAVALEEE